MDIKDILAKLKIKPGAKGLGGFKLGLKPVILAIAVFIILLDAYIIQAAARKIVASWSEEVGARQIASVRVNFEGYNKVLTRINESVVYIPKIGISRNPFSPEEFLEDDYISPDLQDQDIVPQ